MVAPSFQSYSIVSEIYYSNKKAYVKIMNPKTGNTRSCRWYTDEEYQKLYGKPKDSVTVDKYYKTQKEVLGFAKGYITIFGPEGMDEELEYFRYNPFRYCRFWGWYWPSDTELPSDIPEGIKVIRLDWDAVGGPNGSLRDEMTVTSVIDRLFYPDCASQYQGTVGERIERVLTVTFNYHLDTKFGYSSLHCFTDENGNNYTWTTSSKDWPQGSVHKVRGTVKEHRIYKGQSQTVLTRVTEIK